MVYRVSFSLLPDEGEEAVRRQSAKELGVKTQRIEECTVYRKSLDARRGRVLIHHIVDVRLLPGVFPAKGARFQAAPREYVFTVPRLAHAPDTPPVVVGFGPAGMFAALVLAEAGLNPIVIERGKAVEERVRDVNAFFAGGELDSSSNVLFGEGGAGTFSDGKLTTLVKEKNHRGRFVLQSFVDAGAPPEILVWNHPHVGTDRLRGAVKNIRERIKALGGTVLFETRMTELLTKDGAVCGVRMEKHGVQEILYSRAVFLAIGHSARDTFRALREGGVLMEKKIFSVGVRIEHLQKKINSAQYGDAVSRYALPPAEYKLAVPTSNGKTLYTFCMCPGGVVVPAASEEGGVVVNGMSDYERNGENANSALLLNVLPEETGDDLFGGFRFQRELEEKAYRAGQGSFRAPCQLCGDFLQRRESRSFGSVLPTYARGTSFAEMDEVLPASYCASLREGIVKMGQKLEGFDAFDAVLSGVESRATCPIRIVRGENGQSTVAGLFPIGEGAGYAGGIMTSAIDGVKSAERYLKDMEERV